MNLAYHYLEQYFDERARCALGFGGPHEWREQDCLWAQFREIEDALSSGERIEEFAFCIGELWAYLSAECWGLDQLLTEPPSDEVPLEADEYDSMVVYQSGDDLSKVSFCPSATKLTTNSVPMTGLACTVAPASHRAQSDCSTCPADIFHERVRDHRF
jgi:hypothetical protein